jgi:hypothetical protein
VERILESHTPPRVRTAALTCLAEHVAERLPAICEELAAGRQEGILVEIAINLGEMRHSRSDFDGSRHSEAADRAAAVLPPLLKEISDAAFALETKASPVLSVRARELLAHVVPPSEEVRVFRIAVGEHLPIFVPDDVRWILTNTDDVANAVAAIEAAIRHGMTAEIGAGLSHRFADVVACALKAVARPMSPPLPETLLSFAQHKGSPVRRALVQLLDVKPHTQHLPALLLLAKDVWSARSSYQGEEDDYPIAQAAIAAIAKLGAIEHETAEDLYRLAIDTGTPTFAMGSSLCWSAPRIPVFKVSS